MFDAFSFSSRNEPGIYIYINNRSFVETFLTQRVPILERERESTLNIYTVDITALIRPLG